MADLSEELQRQFRDVRVGKAESAGRATAQLAHSIASGVTGKERRDLFPGRGDTSMETMSLRKDLLRDMGRYVDALRGGGGASGAGDIRKSIISATADIAKVWAQENGDYNTAMALQRLKSGTEIQKVRIQTAKSLADKKLSRDERAVTAAYLSLVERMPELGSAEMIVELENIMQRPDAVMSPEAKSMFMAAVAQEMASRGEDIYAILESSAQPSAKFVREWNRAHAGIVEQAEAELDEFHTEAMFDAMNGIVQASGVGPAGQQSMQDMLMATYRTLTAASQGAYPDLTEVDRAAEGALEPQKDQVLEGYEMALQDLDGLGGDDADPRWQEVRAQIMQSPEYLAKADEFGLDPKMKSTFRFFNNLARKQLRQREQINRNRIREAKSEQGLTGPRVRFGKGAAALGGAIGKEANKGTGAIPSGLTGQIMKEATLIPGGTNKGQATVPEPAIAPPPSPPVEDGSMRLDDVGEDPRYFFKKRDPVVAPDPKPVQSAPKTAPVTFDMESAGGETLGLNPARVFTHHQPKAQPVTPAPAPAPAATLSTPPSRGEWGAREEPGTGRLVLVRWNGTAWEDVPETDSNLMQLRALAPEQQQQHWNTLFRDYQRYQGAQ